MKDPLFHVLLALVVVIVAARALGVVFRRIQQPPVIGEVIAGLLLGPSLLGRVAPDAFAYIFPPAIAPLLGIIAQVGVILFMFLVGLELDTGVLRKHSRATIVISNAGVITPFLLGCALALGLYPELAAGGVAFLTFALFLGTAMSVTAFPVLARILHDRGLQKTALGITAIACAAVGDVTAWCLLALVVAVAEAKMGGAVVTIALAACYLAVILFVVRPLAQGAVRRIEERGRVTQGETAAVFVGLLASALATEVIGIHALFGAFILGGIIPHDSLLARELARKLEDVVVILLLPAFFAFTGLRTELGLLHDGRQWLLCGAIVAVASAGKFGGAYVAARAVGVERRDAASLGVLMNTRGLMELVVLNVGLDLHVISPALFTMMVVMAVVTTVATTPALHLLTRGRPLGRAP